MLLFFYQCDTIQLIRLTYKRCDQVIQAQELAHLLKKHPSQPKVKTLDANNKHINGIIMDLKQQAEKFAEEPIEEPTYRQYRLFRDTGDRQIFEQIYFKKRKRLTTFGLLTIVEPNQQTYQQQLEDIIWSICNEFTWCLPAHFDEDSQEKDTIDLFAAETAFALSEIYFLTKSKLDRSLGGRIKAEIEKRIFEPYRSGKAFAWETATHNWAAVCAGSIGASALYLVEDRMELATILEKVSATLSCYLSGFKNDGACTEGYSYWQYGFGFYLYFADLLYQRTDAKVNLIEGKKIEQIAAFQQKCFLDDRFVVNFSDALPEAYPDLGFTHYLNKHYPEIELPPETIANKKVIDHCGRWAPAFRSLYWYDPKQQASDWQNKSYYLAEVGWLISRHFAKSGRFAFAAKAGNNDEPHNHNDIGQFILYGDGQVFVKDLGSGQYNQKYFGRERYQFICTGAQGHTIPIIENQLQKEGVNFKANVLMVEQSSQADLFQLDLSGAYDVRTLQRLKRTFIWKKEEQPCLSVRDSYQFDQVPTQLVEQFIIAKLPYRQDEDQFVFQGEKQSLAILFNSEKVRPAIYLQEFTSHHGTQEKFYLIQFTCIQLTKEVTVDIQFKFINNEVN